LKKLNLYHVSKYNFNKTNLEYPTSGPATHFSCVLSLIITTTGLEDPVFSKRWFFFSKYEIKYIKLIDKIKIIEMS